MGGREDAEGAGGGGGEIGVTKKGEGAWENEKDKNFKENEK